MNAFCPNCGALLESISGTVRTYCSRDCRRAHRSRRGRRRRQRLAADRPVDVSPRLVQPVRRGSIIVP